MNKLSPNNWLQCRDYISVDPDIFKKVKNGKTIGDDLHGGQLLYTPKSLTIKVAATHAGRLTLKNFLYQPRKMKDAIPSWTEPIRRPVLVQHDPDSDPIGRVVKAEYINIPHDFLPIDPSDLDELKVREIYRYLQDSGALFDSGFKGLGYIRLTTAIKDKQAIEKFLDERYVTFSTGAATSGYFCPLCDYIPLGEGDCEHIPGRIDSKGRKSFGVYGDLKYMEVSVAHIPADELASPESMELDHDTHIKTSTQEVYSPPNAILVNDAFISFEESQNMDEKVQDKVETAPELVQEVSVQEPVDDLLTKQSLEVADEHSIEDQEIDLMAIINNADAVYDHIAVILQKMLEDGEIATDAKLSSEQRKKLPSSSFCGPNRSFPTNDCPHVTAARKLLGRAKVSESTKAKIASCVERKAKSLGCGSSDKDSAYEWLQTEAGNLITRLSDFDLATLFEKVTDEVNIRGIKECDPCKELKDKLSLLDAVIQDREQLSQVNSAQQSDLEKLTSALKKSTSVALNLASIVKVRRGEASTVKAEDLFSTATEMTPEEAIAQLNQMVSDTDLLSQVKNLLDGFTGRTLEEDNKDITERPVDINAQLTDSTQVKSHIRDMAISQYKALLSSQGKMAANGYLERLKALKVVPYDFTVPGNGEE